MEFFDNLSSQAGFTSNVTGDLIFLAAIVFFSIGLAAAGRKYLISLLIGSYTAYSLVQILPYQVANINDYASVVIFIILLGSLTVTGNRLFNVQSLWNSSKHLWKLLLMSFLEVALIAAMLIYLSPSDLVVSFVSQESLEIIGNPEMHILWFLAPLVALFFLSKKQ